MATARILRALMRRNATVPDHQAAEAARSLLVDEFTEALERDPRTPVSTPGFVMRDEVPAVELVELLMATEHDAHTLAQFLLICKRYADEDAQALAVLRSLAARFAEEQVSRMVTLGAISA